MYVWFTGRGDGTSMQSSKGAVSFITIESPQAGRFDCNLPTWSPSTSIHTPLNSIEQSLPEIEENHHGHGIGWYGGLAAAILVLGHDPMGHQSEDQTGSG